MAYSKGGKWAEMAKILVQNGLEMGILRLRMAVSMGF